MKRRVWARESLQRPIAPVRGEGDDRTERHVSCSVGVETVSGEKIEAFESWPPVDSRVNPPSCVSESLARALLELEVCVCGAGTAM